MKFRITFTLVLGLVLIHVGEAEGQEPEGRDQRTVWAGVYTDAQARDGRMLADTKCIRCHGEALGGGNAQELLGDRFFERWREDTLASDPVRARKTEAATPLERTLAAARPLATRTFELGNFFMLGSFDRAAYQGHKMFAKGALIRGSDGDRISLFALSSVSVGCP